MPPAIIVLQIKLQHFGPVSTPSWGLLEKNLPRPRAGLPGAPLSPIFAAFTGLIRVHPNSIGETFRSLSPLGEG
jgi:hypothetical protein